jgi:hypothetical protein
MASRPLPRRGEGNALSRVLQLQVGTPSPLGEKVPEGRMSEVAAAFKERKGETPEEAEARRFTFAEALLGAVCSDPAQCSDQRCRRGGLCRHLGDLHQRKLGRGPQPMGRRTPGALALRQAIWVYMNSTPALRAWQPPHHQGEVIVPGLPTARTRPSQATE